MQGKAVEVQSLIQSQDLKGKLLTRINLNIKKTFTTCIQSENVVSFHLIVL
jgi:hypothetical protein